MIAKIIFDLSSNGETKNPLNVNTSIEYIEIYGDVMVIYFDKGEIEINNFIAELFQEFVERRE